MKRIILAMTVAAVTNGTLTLGEQLENQAQERDKQVKIILERVKAGEPSALLELGDIADTNVIPILQKYVLPSWAIEADPIERQFAGQALGKLGAEKHYEALIKRMLAEDTAEADFELLRLFKVVSYIPTKAAVRTVAQFLDDPTVRKQHSDDVLAISVRGLAVDALTRMAKSPSQVIVDPPAPHDRPYYRPEDVEKWQKWWETNKRKYTE